MLYDAFHHGIEVVPHSRLASIYPSPHAWQVNSIHHQAIKKLGNDLVVDAVSQGDRVVEAVRWQGSSYMFGCQWHPEFHGQHPHLLDSSPIMREFLEAAQRAIDGH